MEEGVSDSNYRSLHSMMLVALVICDCREYMGPLLLHEYYLVKIPNSNIFFLKNLYKYHGDSNCLRAV